MCMEFGEVFVDFGYFLITLRNSSWKTNPTKQQQQKVKNCSQECFASQSSMRGSSAACYSPRKMNKMSTNKLIPVIL